jgi:hypothetical protein
VGGLDAQREKIIAMWSAKAGTICCVKTWQTALAIFVALSAAFTLADDFKTLDGKDYKDAAPK